MLDIKIDGTEVAKGIVDLEITHGQLSKVFDKIEKSILKVGDKITVNEINHIEGAFTKNDAYKPGSR